MVQLTLVDQQTEAFQENLLKEEEPIEDDHLCKATGPNRLIESEADQQMKGTHIVFTFNYPINSSVHTNQFFSSDSQFMSNSDLTL